MNGEVLQLELLYKNYAGVQKSKTFDNIDQAVDFIYLSKVEPVKVFVQKGTYLMYFQREISLNKLHPGAKLEKIVSDLILAEKGD